MDKNFNPLQNHMISALMNRPPMPGQAQQQFPGGMPWAQMPGQQQPIPPQMPQAMPQQGPMMQPQTPQLPQQGQMASPFGGQNPFGPWMPR